MSTPTQFFEVRVHKLDIAPALIGLCVGYEQGEWRYDGLVDHLMEWLPDFCLTHGELEGLDSGNMVLLMREAVRKLYTSGKFKSRGEFGELILHAAIRQVFGSIPAISKIYYKSATNNTIKGFDAVHVVGNDEGIELWLGEAKFYTDIGGAISEVVKELHQHLEKDYLRDEFLLIKGKIDEEWKYADELKKLLDPNVSLDEVFKHVVIPVLLTYDSKVVQSYSECSEEYKREFNKEVASNYKKFSEKELPDNIVINLFLVPLERKKQLNEKLDAKLKVWQSI